MCSAFSGSDAFQILATFLSIAEMLLLTSDDVGPPLNVLNGIDCCCFPSEALVDDACVVANFEVIDG